VNNLQNIQNIYFLGIGGIGMSALARYFKITGKNVAGYDRTPTALTGQLVTEGIPVHYEDSPDKIPEPFKNPANTWVVLTPAVPCDHAELCYLRDKRFTIYKRSEILGLITRDRNTVAVAGTHGKTTVSTMIAHIMSKSPKGCNAFLGGISRNFNSNLVLNSKSDWVVTEADEYDRSFLQLHPFAALVTAMDADHLDIYGDVKSMQEAFNGFISQINSNGFLIMKNGLPVIESNKPVNTYTYSLSGKSDFFASGIHLENKRYHFDLVCPQKTIKSLSLDHPGLVNVDNAVAACAMAFLLGIDDEIIRRSLATFSGIQRRFEYQIKTENLVYIDDYAHHPREIEATLKSVRELYPNQNITGIFQPHLFTRTRDFADGFAQSLELLDRLILLDIYPARELPIEGVTSAMIFKNVKITDKIMCTREQLPEILADSKIEVLITLGAGDIDKLVEPIKQLILKKAGI